MSKRCLALVLLLSAAAAAQQPRVAVVVGATGAPVVSHRDRPNRQVPVKILSSLQRFDTLTVPAGSSVTYTVLASGTRYQLSGPATLKLKGDGSAEGASPQPVGSPESRAAIAAAANLNFDKYGGSSSRPTGTVAEGTANRRFFTDSPVFRFDYPAAEQLQVYVFDDHGVGQPYPAVRVQDAELGRERWELRSFQLKPGALYSIHPATADRSREFQVACLLEEDLKAVRKLENSARDLAGQIELLEAYRELHLYDRAERLLQQMRKQHPQVDFSDAQRRLEAERPVMKDV